MARRKRVFIGYSHEDREWLQRIREQLAVLEREGLIYVFTDKEIGAGEDWFARLHEEMLKAKVALLLVSAPFLTSAFIHDEEIPRLFDKHAESGRTFLGCTRVGFGACLLTARELSLMVTLTQLAVYLLSSPDRPKRGAPGSPHANAKVQKQNDSTARGGRTMAEVELNPQPLPPGEHDAPAWWPRLLWQLHFPINRPGGGPGPINFPPAIDDVMAGLHIHTMSYLLEDQNAAQQIRQITEQRLVQSVQNLSKAHDEAAKAAKAAGRGR